MAPSPNNPAPNDPDDPDNPNNPDFLYASKNSVYDSHSSLLDDPNHKIYYDLMKANISGSTRVLSPHDTKTTLEKEISVLQKKYNTDRLLLQTKIEKMSKIISNSKSAQDRNSNSQILERYNNALSNIDTSVSMEITRLRDKIELLSKQSEPNMVPKPNPNDFYDDKEPANTVKQKYLSYMPPSDDNKPRLDSTDQFYADTLSANMLDANKYRLSENDTKESLELEKSSLEKNYVRDRDILYPKFIKASYIVDNTIGRDLEIETQKFEAIKKRLSTMDKSFSIESGRLKDLLKTLSDQQSNATQNRYTNHNNPSKTFLYKYLKYKSKYLELS